MAAHASKQTKYLIQKQFPGELAVTIELQLFSIDIRRLKAFIERGPPIDTLRPPPSVSTAGSLSITHGLIQATHLAMRSVFAFKSLLTLLTNDSYMVNIICLLPDIHPDGPSHQATCAVPQSSLTPEPHLARAGQGFSIELCQLACFAAAVALPVCWDPTISMMGYRIQVRWMNRRTGDAWHAAKLHSTFLATYGKASTWLWFLSFSKQPMGKPPGTPVRSVGLSPRVAHEWRVEYLIPNATRPGPRITRQQTLESKSMLAPAPAFPRGQAETRDRARSHSRDSRPRFGQTVYDFWRGAAHSNHPTHLYPRAANSCRRRRTSLLLMHPRLPQTLPSRG
ncbi:uncharacterized protein CLUP02_11358 [Colletotrichum lupini]|uniref:Uncharacterized protein n=1 Tax=Colletotrichum lupini TaxID=145971 RepID=A0A9Q8SYC4_9PEZI|nr:uncharacterized protein CLUP02_11358 [Colletotrichum lupini]UQC85859.1 hypothetical protein CLUP02_11358 [Colletotrichum lupini]